MSENVVRDSLDAAAASILKARSAIAECERVMALMLPGTAATAYNAARGGSLLWCDLHERALGECERQARKLEQVCGCVGVPLPKVTDPTGDAAVAAQVLADAREAERRATRLAADAAWFVGLTGRYRDADKLPDAGVELAESNAPLCERHLRYGYVVKARGKSPTKVRHKGVEILLVAIRLCRWCEDDVRDRYIDSDGAERRLPTEHEVRRHAVIAKLQEAS